MNRKQRVKLMHYARVGKKPISVVANEWSEAACIRQQPGITSGERSKGMQNSSPARLYALVFGAVLVAAGIVGFFYESEFTDDKSVRDAVFGILDVNGWHNVVHIASGALGLAAFAAGGYPARAYALGLGAVYIV